MEHEALHCDLVVIGAGMAGLSAAGYAAEHGANVTDPPKALAFSITMGERPLQRSC